MVLVIIEGQTMIQSRWLCNQFWLKEIRKESGRLGRDESAKQRPKKI